jgi:hypothetical protein
MAQSQGLSVTDCESRSTPRLSGLKFLPLFRWVSLGLLPGRRAADHLVE